MPDQCCHWVCLEELHPVGGNKDNIGQGGGGPVINVRYTPGNGADIGLRLVYNQIKSIKVMLYQSLREIRVLTFLYLNISYFRSPVR